MKHVQSIFAAVGLCALLIGLSACTTSTAVPKGALRLNPRTGWLEIKQPKDVELKNVQFTVVETNGVKMIQVTIGEYSTKNNPETIEKSALGTASMINAGADAGVRYFTLGLQAAQAAGAVPKLPTVPASPPK